MKIERRILLAFSLVVAVLPMQSKGQEIRIKTTIDANRIVKLHGNTNPKALPQYDAGPVDPTFKLDNVRIVFKRSVQQQAALDQLLAQQQDRSSPNYHQWLTPEEYATRFGLSTEDVNEIRTWLEAEGFTINYVARGRSWIAFSGTAAQVQAAFHTEIHHYNVDGRMHFSNANEPSIPESLEPTIYGILGLDDFLPKPPTHRFKTRTTPSIPAFTASNGEHALVPDDIATIYDIMPLYQAGLDGSGQRLVVVGQSAIDLADVATFRQGILSANAPEILLVPGSSDPGTTGDETEADLDLEWVGAVARNATINYVYAVGANAAAIYAIDQALAPIISESFGTCEASATAATLLALRTFAQQANAEGITWIASTGDSGAAACDSSTAPVATHEAAVEAPASIPEVTAVGGTTFNEGTGDYWSNTNSSTLASALSYIPEVAWNDSLAVGQLAASGGGVSVSFQQPPWQLGPGLLNGVGRETPDISMAASPNHDGYVVVSQGQLEIDGGTSAATPVLAGIVALVNQNERSDGLGNINPNLYRLAQTNIFHDITTGNNAVPCVIGSSADCTTGSFGYLAGPAYDPVTGIGSVDAYNLVAEWNAATPSSNIVPACTPNPVYEQQPNPQGYSWFYTVSLTETTGFGTSLTGFIFNGTDYSSQIANYFGTSVIPGKGTISANLQSKGLAAPTTVTFAFSGIDAGGRQWSKQLSVPFDGMQSSTPTPSPSISSVVNAASYQSGMSPGALATLFGKNLSSVVGIESPGGATSYDGVSVTVAGRLAPLFTVANVNGQEQINFQVPTEVPAIGAQTVQVNNNGSIGSTNVAITTVQPGIFAYVPPGSSSSYAVIVKPDGSVAGPSNPASRGSTVVMYLTGLGTTSPALSTGQSGPVPPATTNYIPVVTLNGVSAPVGFSGIAPGFIGLDQINFTIPTDAPVGSTVQLGVSVNGVSSPISTVAVQ